MNFTSDPDDSLSTLEVKISLILISSFFALLLLALEELPTILLVLLLLVFLLFLLRLTGFDRILTGSSQNPLDTLLERTAEIEKSNGRESVSIQGNGGNNPSVELNNNNYNTVV